MAIAVINSKPYVLVKRRREIDIDSRDKDPYGETIKNVGGQTLRDLQKPSIIFSDFYEGIGLNRVPSDWTNYPTAPRRSYDATADTRWDGGVYLPLLQQDASETGLEVIRASSAYKSNLWAAWEDNASRTVLARKFDADDDPQWEAGGVIGNTPLQDGLLTSLSAVTAGSGATSLTFACKTRVAANRAIIVAVATKGADPSGVTYNGVALTRLSGANEGTRYASLWYLANPASGTNNVVVSLGSSNAIIAASYSFSHVNQSSVLSNAATNTSGGATSSSATVTSTIGDVVIDSIAVEDEPVFTVGAGQTQKAQLDSDDTDTSFGSSYETATTTSTAMTWAIDASKDIAHVAARVNGLVMIGLDLIPHKSHMLGLVAAGDSHDIIRSTDGVTWTECATPPTVGLLDNDVTANEDIDAGLLAEIGGEGVAVLWDETASTITFFSSTDGGDVWADEAVDIPSGNGPQGVAVMKGVDNEDKLYVGTREGLWEVDTAPSTWTFRQVDTLPPHNDNCRRMTVHQRDLWYGLGVSDDESAPVHIYTSQEGQDRVITRGREGGLVGLNVDQGMPLDRLGPIRRMVSAGGQLFVSVGGGASGRNGSVYAHNGRGWHSVMKHGTANKEVQWIAVSPDDDGTQRLHWAVRTATSTSDARYSEHPLTDPASNVSIKREASGYIYLPYTNAGMPTYQGPWLQTRIEADNVDATDSEYLNIDYGIDGTARGSFTNLGDIVSGTKVLEWASGAGVAGFSSAHNVNLHRDGSVNTHTPIFRSLEIVYTKVVPRRNIYELTVDVRATQEITGRSPKAIYDDLVTASEQFTLPTTIYADMATIYGKLSIRSFQEIVGSEPGLNLTGADTSGSRYGFLDITIEEIT